MTDKLATARRWGETCKYISNGGGGGGGGGGVYDIGESQFDSPLGCTVARQFITPDDISAMADMSRERSLSNTSSLQNKASSTSTIAPQDVKKKKVGVNDTVSRKKRAATTPTFRVPGEKDMLVVAKNWSSGPHPTPLPINKSPELKEILNVPTDLYTNPEKYDRRNIHMFNFLVVHYEKVKHIKTMGGQKVHHILFAINWKRPLDCKDPFVTLLLHYCTLESAMNYTLSDHPATKRKKDNTLSARTFNCRLEELGEVIYSKLALKGDHDPAAYLKDTKLTDLLSREDAECLSASYAVVLKAMDAMSDYIYLGSKATARKYGDSVHGGRDQFIAAFNAKPGKYISALEVLAEPLTKKNFYNVFAYHPSSQYDKEKQSDMKRKSIWNDACATDTIQKFPGYKNEKCTVNWDLYSNNAEFHEWMQKIIDEKRALGRENSANWKRLASAILRESNIQNDNAESYCGVFSLENFNAVKQQLKESEIKLYNELLRKHDNHDALEAKLNLHSTFTVASQIAAHIGRDMEVNIAAIAKYLDMDPEVLQERVETQICNQEPAKLAAKIGRGETVNIAASAESLGMDPEVLQQRVETQMQNQAPLKLAAKIGRGETVNIAASAESLGMDPEVLQQRVETQCDIHNNLAGLSRAAAAARRGKNVNIEALAKTQGKSVPKMRESLENSQCSQNNLAGLSRAAAAARRGKNVNIEALAKTQGKSVPKMRESLENSQCSHNNLADLSRAAAAARRGKNVNIEALAKTQGKSVPKMRESLENSQCSHNNLAGLSRAAAAARRGKNVNIEALAKTQGKSVPKMRESLENSQCSQNNLAGLSRAAAAARRGKNVNIEALAKTQGKSVPKMRESLENSQRRQQSFATTCPTGERQVVVAEYGDEIIGSFAMAAFKNKSSDYAKRYSLMARLQQLFINKPVKGLNYASIMEVVAGKRPSYLGMTLRNKRSTEQFTEEELRTGFHENEPAFEEWKKANKLIKITHMKDDGSNICEGGTIYRTSFQIKG